VTCPACGGRGYTVSEHSDEHGVYQDSYECEECRHDLSETCACCGHWHGAHHEDQDGVRMHCEAAGCRCPEYTTIEDVMIDEHVRRIAMRDAARVACRRLRLERDDARRQLAVAVRERDDLTGALTLCRAERDLAQTAVRSERARADALARELATCLEEQRVLASDVAEVEAERDDARLRLDEALREQAPREPKPHWASRWEDGDIVEEDRTRLHAYSSDHCIRVSKDQQSLLLIADDALALIARHYPELLRGGK
jgi:hypothetical protein